MCPTFRTMSDHDPFPRTCTRTPDGTREVSAREGATCIPPPGPLVGRHLLRAPIDARSSLLASPSTSAGWLSKPSHVRRSAIEHARQEPKAEPRTRVVRLCSPRFRIGRSGRRPRRRLGRRRRPRPTRRVRASRWRPRRERESEPDLRDVDFEGNVHDDSVYRSVCILPGELRTTILRGGPHP